MTTNAGITVSPHSATLMALGAQRIVVQKRPTDYRGRLAIYADRSLAGWGRAGTSSRPNVRMLGGFKFERDRQGLLLHDIMDDPYRVPEGFVVASAMLTDCVPIIGPDGSVPTTPHIRVDGDDLLFCELDVGEKWPDDAPGFRCDPIEEQLPFSDFTDGRFAWIFDTLAPVHRRCPTCWGDRVHGPLPCPTCNLGGHALIPGTCRPFPLDDRPHPKGSVWGWHPSLVGGPITTRGIAADHGA